MVPNMSTLHIPYCPHRTFPLGAASGILGDTSHLEGQTDNRLQVGENHSNHLQGNLSVSLTRNLSPRYLSVFKPYAPRLPLTELLNLKEQLWMPPCLFQTSPPQNYISGSGPKSQKYPRCRGWRSSSHQDKEDNSQVRGGRVVHPLPWIVFAFP